MRAIHRLLDAHPLVFDDAVSLILLGENTAKEIEKNHEYHRTLEARAMRTSIVLRSRFTEDRLAEAVERGATQYIIFGAGFETFAFRQPSWARKLKIFEVDQPATQAQKRSWLKDVGIDVPANLFFADIDFERESLRDGLIRQGVSFQEVSFISWLGVAVYLHQEAIDAVLRTVSEFSEGSEIVFTFFQPLHLLSDIEKKIHSSLSKVVEQAGEPFISYFTHAEIEKKLKDFGFKSVDFLSEEEAEKRYLDNRPRDLLFSKRSIVADAKL
jgi:methyltransferase (TIGR00027 family)